MGRLKDFRRYLSGREKVLRHAETALCALQEKYESFFQEVAKTRESELEQLIELTLADRSVLPSWFNADLDAVEKQISKELEEQLDELEKQRQSSLERAEAARQESFDGEREVLRSNRALDRTEENLKERNQRLLAGIGSHNERITELGRGFGFFSNFFKLREIAREKKRLDEEQTDVAANIEALRARWQREEGEYEALEQQRQNQWIAEENRVAALGAKIEALRQARPKMVVRSTVERVLADHRRHTTFSEDGAACPRCGVSNHEHNHFCHVCAERLGQDRGDFDGSLEEITELNQHFIRFSDGMQACQQIIGLVRGMISGLQAFAKSVVDVEESEDKYPLPKLEIEVPASSRDYGVGFDRLKSMTDQDLSLHPKDFADRVQELVNETFTEAKIKAYFETMGEELSRQAAAQWD